VGVNFRKPTPLFQQILERIISQKELKQLDMVKQINLYTKLVNCNNVSLITDKRALIVLIESGHEFSSIDEASVTTKKRSIPT
jgi:hypothetical protein